MLRWRFGKKAAKGEETQAGEPVPAEDWEFLRNQPDHDADEMSTVHGVASGLRSGAAEAAGAPAEEEGAFRRGQPDHDAEERAGVRHPADTPSLLEFELPAAPPGAPHRAGEAEPPLEPGTEDVLTEEDLRLAELLQEAMGVTLERPGIAGNDEPAPAESAGLPGEMDILEIALERSEAAGLLPPTAAPLSRDGEGAGGGAN